MAAESSHSFKRLVVGFHAAAPDRALQLAVELADLLKVNLLGLFVEDTGLRDLARIPFAREFQLLGGGWHPIDLDRLSRDLEFAAHNVERMFSDAAKRLPSKWEFEIVRGRTAEAIASVSRTDDIVMIIEPASAAERATQQFLWLIEAALRSAAAVILVPPQVARASGPVVAVARSADDPSILTAGTIAMAAKEELIVAEAYKADASTDARLAKWAADMGISVKRVAVGDLSHQPARIVDALRGVEERFVVVTRGVLSDEAAITIASARCVPVLLIEPVAGGLDRPGGSPRPMPSRN